MPELPEVETVRRTLLDRVTGRRIAGVRVGDFAGVVGDLGPAATAARLVGRHFVGITRRGKYLFFALDDDTTLLVHLRMTGRLLLLPRPAPPERFEHLAIELDDGHDLRYADQRKFGRVLALTADEAALIERRLGPEPLEPEFDVDRLATALHRRVGRLKSVLLDQRVIAGLGNIYVDEALFRARLHPLRAAGSLADEEIARLHSAIRTVLAEGLDNRGTTLSSFADAYGAAGGNQGNLRVYGRGDGAPCPECGTALVRLVVGGRGTHICPRCQI